MRFLVFVAVLLQTYLTVSGSEVPFETCESPVFIPDSVIITPYPVKLSEKLVVEIKGVTDLTVTGGTFEYEIGVKWKALGPDAPYLIIDAAVEDLCHRALCPIKPGPIKFEYRKTLPPILKAGVYRIKIKAKTGSGATLLCLLVHLDFVSSFEHEKQSLIT